LVLVRGSATVQRLFALAAVDEAFEMVSDLPLALTAT
jgi:anti-sigma B factor antagonist